MIPLLILGLLKEKPGAYGYELLANMEANYFQYFVRFTKGSFYYNMQQLEEKGQIEKISPQLVEQKEKNCYRLTDLGEKEFERLFVRYGGKNDPITFPFYTPMLFEEQVSPAAMQQLLEKQIQQTQEKIRLIELALTSTTKMRPNFVKMLENSKRHHEVNLAWFQEQLE